MTETEPRSHALRPPPLSPGGGFLGVLGGHARAWAPAVSLLVLVVAFGIAEPQFLSPNNLATLASQAAIPLILATGMSFVILQGSIDLSVEGVMGACSLIFALLVHNDRSGIDLSFLAVAAGALVGGAFGTLNGLLVTRLRIPSFMVTLGVWSFSSGVAMLISGGQPPRILDMGMRTWALGSTGSLPNLAIIAVVFLAVGYVLQAYTRIGRYTFVIGGSEEIARLSGIAVDRFKVLAFAFSGLSAGLAAALESARLGLGHVEIGADQMFLTLTAIVIGGTSLSGGRGGVVQSAIGVVILTVLANGMIFVGVTPYLQKAVQGIIILVAVTAATWHLRSRLRVVK